MAETPDSRPVTPHEGRVYVPPKKTQRKAILKLELSGETRDKLGTVAQGLYGMSPVPDKPAANNQKWHTVDKELYAVAKGSYDGVIAPFLEQPRVYRFESTKQKLWDDLVRIEKENREKKLLAEMEKSKAEVGAAKKKARQQRKLQQQKQEEEKLKEAVAAAAAEAEHKSDTSKPIEPEDQIDTFLDPFALPSPWRMEVNKAGQVTYFNPETSHRMAEKPTDEVWSSKVALLDRLKPREDLDGYEYMEDANEKKKRLAIFAEFQSKLQQEVDRRIKEPTDLEQVEDALFYIVDTIAVREDQIARQKKKKEREALIKSWHPATKGYRFKPLGTIEDENGETTNVVTDLKFTDMLISSTGAVLPLTTPPGLFEKHEAERAVKREAERVRLEAIERDRNMPLNEKAALILEMAEYDREAAMEKVKDEVRWRVRAIPRKLREMNRYLLEKGSKAVLRGVRSLLEASKNPKETMNVVVGKTSKVVSRLVNGPPTREELELQKLLNDVHEEEMKENEPPPVVEVVPVESEHDRRLREYRAKQPKPIKFADTVQITMTLLVDPPPHLEKKLASVQEETLKEIIVKKMKVLDEVTDTLQALRGVSLRVMAKDKLTLSDTFNTLFGAETESPKRRRRKRPPVLSIAGVAGNKFVSDAEHERLLELERELENLKLDMAKQERAIAKGAQGGVQDSPIKLPGFKDRANSLPPLFSGPSVHKSNQGDESKKKVDTTGTEKEVLDGSVRSAFESQLVQELAAAVCLPVGNISIEEIRRLPPNDPKLLELKQRWHQLREDQDKMFLVMEQQAQLDQERRRALMDGTFDEKAWLDKVAELSVGEGSEQLGESFIHMLEAAGMDSGTVLLSRPSSTALLNTHASQISLITSNDFPFQNSAALMEPSMDTLPETIGPSSSHPQPPPISSDESKDGPQDAAPTGVSPSGVDDSVAVHSSPVIEVFDPSLPPAVADADTRNEVTSDVLIARQEGSEELLTIPDQNQNLNQLSTAGVSSLDDESTVDGNSVVSEVKAPADEAPPLLTSRERPPSALLRIPSEVEELRSTGPIGGASKATKPSFFKLGLPNPDDLKFDPSYWLSKDFRELNAEEKRQRRIRKLRLSVKETGLKLRLQQLKQLKNEMMFDAGLYIDPIVERLAPFVEHTKTLQSQTQKYLELAASASSSFLATTSAFGTSTLLSLTGKVDRSSVNNIRSEVLDVINYLCDTVELRAKIDSFPFDSRALHGRGANWRDVQLYDPDIISVMEDILSALEERVVSSGGPTHQSLAVTSPEPDSALVPVGADNENIEPQHESLVETNTEAVPVVVDGKDEPVVVDGNDDERRDESRSQAHSESAQQLEEDAVVKEIQLLQARQLYLDLTDEQYQTLEENNELVRQERLQMYEEEVVDLVTKMCIAVELAASFEEERELEKQLPPPSIPSMQPDPSAAQHRSNLEAAIVPDDRLFGCEVTVMIFVNDEQRKIEGLEDIEAEDVAVMLRQQLNDRFSSIYSGDLTRHILDVRYKIAHKRLLFKTWESYWVHSLHPVFFGYSTYKEGKKKKKSVESGVVMPYGVKTINPISKFSERSKDTFTMLNERDKATQSTKTGLIRLEIDDEFADTNNWSTLKIFRPNMSNLTHKDVERLRRVHKAFEEKYEELMRKGLVDGKRMRHDQYQAMKERDSAYRIFRTARQRWHQMSKEEDIMPKLQLTEIKQDDFDRWVQEVKDEEMIKLKEQRLKTQKDKKLRQQEALLRGKFTNQRAWFISQLIRNSISPVEIAMAFEAELKQLEAEHNEVKVNFGNPMRLAQLNEKFQHTKTLVIAEQKRTRKLFGQVNAWVVSDLETATAAAAKSGKMGLLSRKSSPVEGMPVDDHDHGEDEGAGQDDGIMSLAMSDLLSFLSQYYQPPNKDGKKRVQIEDPKEGKIATTISKVEGAEVVVEAEKPISSADIALCKSIGWVNIAKKRKEFLVCLENLPTMEPGKLARDELIQFASLVVELEPLYSKVVDAYIKAKEDAAVAAGLRKLRKQSRKEAKSAKLAAMAVAEAEANEKAEQDALLAEAAAEQEEERRRAFMEKYPMGFVNAHQHRYVKLPGQDPFCIVCVERVYDLWLEEKTAEEEKWIKEFNDELIDNIAQTESALKEEVALEYQAYLQKMALSTNFFQRRRTKLKRDARKQKKLFASGVTSDAKTISKESYNSQSTELSSLSEDDIVALIDELTAKDPNLFGTSFTSALRSSGVSVLPPMIREVPMNRNQVVPPPLVMSGLSWHEPTGKSLLPEAEPEPEDEGNDIVSVASVDDEDDDGNPPLGIMVRFWHLDADTMTKGAFLGQFKWTYPDIMEPPKGFRAFNLVDNEACRKIGKYEAVPTGTVTVKLNPFARDKETKEPISWKFELIRASGLLAVTQLRTSSPVCEVFWRGPAEKNDKDLLFRKWIKVGETSVKHNTLDPVFARIDKSEYELPPVWTDVDIAGRGPMCGPLVGGGWVSRNNLPNEERVRKEKAEKAAEEKAEKERAAVDQNVLSHSERIAHIVKGCLANQVQLRMEMTKLLWLAEENERQLMSKEEVDVRQYLLDVEMSRCRPYLNEQVELGRQFTTMIEHIHAAPTILSRLRFLSAKRLDSGGMKVECKDPTSGKVVYTLVIPIMYPEDEADLCSQLGEVLGTQHPNLIKVLDFSTHQVRTYNLNGFAAINERVVLAVVEKVETGITVIDFIKYKWETITDDNFKDLLKQILNGLQALHDVGIIHRNINANCVLVYEQATTLARKRHGKSLPPAAAVSGTDSASPLRMNAICKLGDYWFFENPRRAGCLYSQGRADWGSLSTTPPEVFRGIVSEKSDIYAFGMCTLQWASRGSASLEHKQAPSLYGLDGLRVLIPLKWGDWVHAMLRMCLQPNPDNRPSAKELIQFLNSKYAL